MISLSQTCRPQGQKGTGVSQQTTKKIEHPDAFEAENGNCLHTHQYSALSQSATRVTSKAISENHKKFAIPYCTAYTGTRM